MYCPSCGKQAVTVQKFCRSCGFGLQEVTKLLANQPPTVGSDKVQFDQQLSRWVFWGLIGSVGGLVIAALGDKAIADIAPTIGQVVEFFGKVMLAVGVGLLISSGIRAVWFQAYGGSVSQPPPQQTALPQAALTTELQSDRHSEPIPSVTEHTTERLENAEARHLTGEKARQER